MIAGNDADDYGGAISGYNSDVDNGSTIKVTNSKIVNNVGDDGPGGIITGDGKLTVIRSTIANNTSDGYGGAIYNDGADIKFESVTIFHNHAYASAGIYNGGGTLTFRNSMIAGNTPTLELLPQSPAPNKAKNCPKTDQRGHTRKKSKCDIGAFER